MRVYFLSSRQAILKLNGMYAGGVDFFERHIEIDPADRILAEIVPGDNFRPVSFFIDEKLIASPPPFLDLYHMESDILIYARSFAPYDNQMRVIFQTRFSNNLVTLFSQGERYLCAEGESYNFYPLGGGFSSVEAAEKSIANFPVLALYSGGTLIIISQAGKMIFSGRVESAEFGESLKTRTNFDTCAKIYAECEYSYDGENLTLVKSASFEEVPADEKIIHFAFFESFLLGADYEKYLSPALLPKAGELKSYLGGFAGVSVPTEKFYSLHPDERAAGLIYKKSQNLFEVKYFAVDLDGGKIDNIRPLF